MGRRVITVSREAGAYGHEVVAALSQKFNTSVLDESTLPKQKGKYGIPDFPLEHFDEKKPSIWDSFSMGKERYLSFLKTAIFDLAIQQDLVISGHGGVFILEDVPGVLKIRLVADEERRIAHLQQRDNCSADQARHSMHHIDRLRKGFHRFFFDRDWNGNEYYDIVFNSNRLSVEQIVEMVGLALKQHKSEDALPVLKNRLLAEQAMITLLYRENLDIDLLNVNAQDGVLDIQGIVPSQTVVDKAGEVTSKMEGVTRVSNQLRVVDSNISYLMTL